MQRLNSLCRSVTVASVALLSSGAGAGAASPAADQNTVQEQTIGAIRAYLTTSWRNAGIRRQDWDDCTQQAFLRVLQRLQQADLPDAIQQKRSHERRELNRCIWATVQNWRRRARRQAVNSDFDVRDTQSERRDDAAARTQHAREIVQDPRNGLSPRQQHILNASLEGQTVAEISAQLNIPTNRVSDEKYKAVQKLRQRLQA